MILFSRLISITIMFSLVCATAVAESVGPVPRMPVRLMIKKTEPKDPNLERNKDKSKTEADFCTHCSVRAPATQNQKDIKAVQEKIAVKEVQPAKLKHVEAAGKWNEFPEVMQFSDSKQINSAIAFAMKNKSPNSKKYCYRGVKKALVAGGVVKKYPPGEHAKQAVRDLKAQGLINMLDHPIYKKIIKNPEDAPKGAMLVYANDTKESGDIQIKKDWGSEGGYVSDFYSNNSYLSSPKARRYARAGQPYKIIGVMIKLQRENPT